MQEGSTLLFNLGLSLPATFFVVLGSARKGGRTPPFTGNDCRDLRPESNKPEGGDFIVESVTVCSAGPAPLMPLRCSALNSGLR